MIVENQPRFAIGTRVEPQGNYTRKMLRNYLAVATSESSQNKLLSSLINILGLGLGLDGICDAGMGQWVIHEPTVSPERRPDLPDQCTFSRATTKPSGENTPAPIYTFIPENLGEVEEWPASAIRG